MCRVIERGEYLGFAMETCNTLWIAREAGRKDFQRDVTAKLGVACACRPSPIPPAPSAEQHFKRADAANPGLGLTHCDAADCRQEMSADSPTSA